MPTARSDDASRTHDVMLTTGPSLLEEVVSRASKANMLRKRFMPRCNGDDAVSS